ncbi:MAG: sporulation protein YunB [Clostridia bacterium]|nr:sporulation protein YunB [Clostridia bacterium]
MTAQQLKKYTRRIRRRRLARRGMMLVLLAAALFLLADRNVKPLVFSLAEARSAAMASAALNGAIADALGDGMGYQDLMHVRMDAQGQVALLSANTAGMNSLAARAGAAALARLESMSSEEVGVPLGALLGVSLLAGTGPKIPVSIVPVGSIMTDFETEFEASGINQTRHKVFLELTASIRIVIPTGAKTTQVTANMLVAESIIVGGVPEGFVGYELTDEEMNLVP